MSQATSAATPFFGSKISLISKSEIRYEGILYTVDPKESTIALAQVRSFGSEDRIIDKPVPPRDEIFQYIIFRASDIKDLIVDKPPSPALTDPAIIQATTSQSSPFPSFPQASIGTPANVNANVGSSNVIGSGNAPSTSSASSIQQQLQQAGIPNASNVVASAIGSKSVGQAPVQHQDNANKQVNKNVSNAQTASTSGSQAHQGSKAPGRQKPLPQRTSNQVNHQQPSTSQSRQDGSSGSGSFMNRQNNQFNNRRMNQTRAGSGGQMNGFQQRNGGIGMGGFQRTSFSNRFQNQHGGHRSSSGGISSFNNFNRRPMNRNFANNRQSGSHPKPTLNLPDSDFDFEKAQDEFKQLEEKLAGLKVNGDSSNAVSSSDNETTTTNGEPTKTPVTKTEADTEVKEPCYNKERSFFDQISCEALEREKGNVQRVDWKAERKLNRETFGVVAPMRRNNGFRTNNRFGGYRGYHQHNYRSRNNQTSGSNPVTKPQQNGVSNSSNSTSANTSNAGAASVSTSTAVSSNLVAVSPAKN